MKMQVVYVRPYKSVSYVSVLSDDLTRVHEGVLCFDPVSVGDYVDVFWSAKKKKRYCHLWKARE